MALHQATVLEHVLQPTLVDREPVSKAGRAAGAITFAFFILCGIGAVLLDGPPHPQSEQTPGSVFSAARAMKHLAVIGRAPHPIHSAEHDVVRNYIVSTLRGLGLAPLVQSTDANKSDDSDGAIENIVCRLPGSTHEKAVLLVAHYDSVPYGPGASDDGVAVSGLLETARAILSQPKFKRDIILLFSDGEEAGLLGSQLFIQEHPWAHDVGLVLNFEARGTGGPSIMFETSDQNGWLISQFGSAVSHPVANSLSYEIYKRLPNDTDFTMFRRAGYSGLNFAFIDGLAYYHTPLDSIQNVNSGSLQQQGDYMLEMATQFGNASVADDPKRPDAIYFDVMGLFLVRYQKPASVFFLVMAGILVALTAYFGYRKQNVKIGGSMVGLLSMLACAAITMLASEAVLRLAQLAEERFSAIHTGLVYHSGIYVAAFLTIGLACGTAVYSLLLRWLNPDNVVMGSLLGWFGLTLAVSMYFPGGSYLLLWPLLFVLCGWVAVFARQNISPKARSLVLAVSGVPAIVVMTPMMHKIFFAFAAQSTLIISALLGLLLALLAGQTMSRRWLLPLLLSIAGAGLLATAIAIPSGEHTPAAASMGMKAGS